MADIRYEISAFNTSIESENLIHDDAMAKRFGFEGGLVPGVDVHAYMTRAALLRFGADFLTSGWIESRFTLPVYDGETVVVTGSGEKELAIAVSARGKALATGSAGMAHGRPAPDIADYAVAVLPSPAQRPPAGPATLIEGAALGTITETMDAEEQVNYRTDVRETLPLYQERGLVHPAFLLRRANSALKDNVLLGPWMHVGSTFRHFAPLEAGAPLETRSRVSRIYDHKGHGFVDLDVALFSDGNPIAQIDHISIYEPRQVRQSA